MEVTKHCPKSCTQVQVAWLRLERLQSYAEKSLRKVLNTDRILMIEMGGFDPCRHCPDMINKQYLIRIIFRKHWWTTLFEVKRPTEQNEMRFRALLSLVQRSNLYWFYGGRWNLNDFRRKCSIGVSLHASNLDWYCSTLPLHHGKRQHEDLCFKLVRYQDCGTTKKIRLSQNLSKAAKEDSFPWPKRLKWQQFLPWHLFLMKTNKLNLLCVFSFPWPYLWFWKINEIPKLVKISRTHPIRSMSPWKLPKKGKLDENFPVSTRHTRAR